MGEDVTLPPGFRFHPTDEELVSYYLRRKISGKSFNLNAIAEVDLYKTKPWDLPGKSCLKNRDLEWYFFSPLDKKYGIGARTNRATEQGYWKVTGKDREVRRKSKKLGLKKTLVFYQGRAPLGERTNWVMHEYRLVDDELGKAGIQHVKNSFVLCRVFKKSGSGPKTSEHYGAPLIEEEWDESDAPKSGQLPLSMFSHPAPSSSESPKMQSSDHGEKQPVSYGISPQDGLDPMDGDDNWPKEDDIASIAAAVAAAVACLVATSNNMNNDDPPPCNNYLTVRATGRLHDTIHCSVDEQVAMFMHIVAHNVKIRALKFYFRRSGETVSRYFNNVLHSIIGIEEDFMKTPEPETPKEILDNPKWWPYFKDCIGAIDGTHILVKVSCEHLPRFRGRKHLPTQNVMAACSFNLKFIYVLAGWEGSASDSRILASALTRENDIQCPPGKYYVVDTGYPLLKQFITPFRSVRYHLNDIRGRAPTTPKELFNQRHLSLRNAIERIFGVWKKRFKILVEEPMYPFKVQVKLVLACCIIHNFVRGVMPNDPLLEEVDREQGTQAAMLNDAVDSQLSRIDDAREGKRIREVIMNHMWTDFNSCHC